LTFFPRSFVSFSTLPALPLLQFAPILKEPPVKATIALGALLFLAMGSLQVLADDKPTSLSEARAAVEANLRTPEGKAYDQQLGKEFPQKYLDTMKQCKQSAGNDLADFWMLIRLDKSGAVKEVLVAPAS
jgi:hypothetical protein